MTRGIFSSVFADQEERQRAGAMPGLRYAEVNEITDEGYVLKWLTGTVSSLSAPARTARFMAGKERGAYFPFEKGDEVVVGFEDGNIDRPVILGGLWSDEDAPPANVDTSSSNDTRSIVSREKSELTFGDKKGETKVLLKSAGGIQLMMDDKPGAVKSTLEMPGGMMVELDETGKKLTLKNGDLVLEMDGTGQKVTLKLNASTYIELAASGITVKGTKIDLNP